MALNQRLCRPALGASACLFAALLFHGAAAAVPSPWTAGAWAQTYSDLKPEADIRFGTLPNGLRYAVMHNATPSGQVSLRLRIGAGSLQERGDQRGLAHFLEHMAFKGSTHVPSGELIKILERKGLAFGADINASTDYRQTVFRLDLPRSDGDSLSTGLMLLREVGSELSLTQGAMDSERGVVLSEERAGESPAKAFSKSSQAFLLEGQLAAQRDPIGLTDVVRGAPVSLIRQYYEAYYRPENATLVAVGDFDVAAMETMIRARFADWCGKGPPGAAPALGLPERRGETVHLVVHEGLPQVLGVAWVQPYDDAAETFARDRRRLIEALGIGILNARLARLASAADPPFIAAGVSRGETLRSARVTKLVVVLTAGGLARGLAAVTEQRRIVRDGVSQAELLQSLTDVRARLNSAVASSSTRATAALADGLVGAVNEDEVFAAPEQTRTQFEASVKDLTLAEVNSALRAAFTGSGPLIEMASPHPVEGGDAAIKVAFDTAAAQPLSVVAAEDVKPWPYDSFGAPGRVVWRRDIADLGFTQVRFANGVRLNVKPTAFNKDGILITARIGDGLLGLPVNQPASTWLAGALGAGGTQELTADELRKSLAGAVVGAGFAMSEDAFILSGQTRRQDLGKELQLMTAMISRPGYRPEAVERVKAAIGAILPMLDATPQGVMMQELPQRLHGGDARWRDLPTATQAAALRPTDLPALVGRALKSGAMEVTIVGDLTVDEAIAAVGATLATLPHRDDPKLVPKASRTIRPPAAAPEPTVLFHKGRSDQAIAYVEWPATDFYAAPREARVRDVAIHVLQNRLIDRVRIAEGATYSPSASGAAATDLVGFGYIEASVEIPPQKILGFYREVAEIVADMGRNPPSADELKRAEAPMLEQAAKAREANAFWLGTIASSQADPRVLDNTRTLTADLRSVTGVDVVAVSRKYLRPDRSWKLIVRPAYPATKGDNSGRAPGQPVGSVSSR